MIRGLATLLTLLALLSAARANEMAPAEFHINGIDGTPMANHRLSADQMAQVERLPGIIAVGNLKGDVTLYEFYDLNCPYCRQAASDLEALLQVDHKLRLAYVPYPVLSAASVEGARVELALREIVPPGQFQEFHRRVYALRGVINGFRSLAAAKELGVDRARIMAIANEPRITETMRTHARLGTKLKLMATPSYVIAGVAILGHPGQATLRQMIGAVRQCGQISC
jgi:protein-disulfide isomerase